MVTEQKFFDEYDEAEFLEMCRLASSQDTGGQWTDEKIDAIDTVKGNARFAVRRLFGIYTAQRERAEAAEAELADAYETIISLKRSEGHDETTAVERLRTLRPDSEYLRA